MNTSARPAVARHLQCSAAAFGSILVAIVMAGCSLPGKPKPGPEVPRPSAQLDFDELYSQNCSGCHGDHGQHGAAVALNNPEYLAIVDDGTLRAITANGYVDSLMPGFSKGAGGFLTDQQIDAIVKGMRQKWGKDNVLAGQNPPPYHATGKGDVARGGQVYIAACARCHGAPGTGAKHGSILNGSYLALMNEQSLRTITIVGRPEYGMPDWRGDVPGHPLSNEQVTDVVAWLQAQTPNYPGQPYASKQDNGQTSPLPSNAAPNFKFLPNQNKERR